MWDFSIGTTLSILGRTMPFILLRMAVYFGITFAYIVATGAGAATDDVAVATGAEASATEDGASTSTGTSAQTEDESLEVGTEAGASDDTDALDLGVVVVGEGEDGEVGVELGGLLGD